MPHEVLIEIAKKCFWARAQMGSVDPVQEKSFFELNLVRELPLRPLITQARSRSFEECHDHKPGYLNSNWSGYRLAAFLAYYLVSQWEYYIDGPPPLCRPDLIDHLGDFALSTHEDADIYVQICAMDIAGEVIALIEGVDIGFAPFQHITESAMRFADSLTSMMGNGSDDGMLWPAIPILQRQLEAMGRIASGETALTTNDTDHSTEPNTPNIDDIEAADGYQPDPTRGNTDDADHPTDIDTTEHGNEHQSDTTPRSLLGPEIEDEQPRAAATKSDRWRNHTSWIKYGAAVAAGALLVAAIVSIRQAPDSNGQGVSTTTTTLTTTLAASPRLPSPDVGAAPASPVVHNVTELVSAVTTDGKQSSFAAPWSTTPTPLVLDLYDSAKRGFVVTITLQTEVAQSEDIEINLTLGKARGLNFTDNETYVTDKYVINDRQDPPIGGKPLTLTIAGDRTPTTYSTEIYVNETQNVQAQIGELPQELAVFTCGVSVLTFEVLLAENHPNSLNVTVPVPLLVVKRC